MFLYAKPSLIITRKQIGNMKLDGLYDQIKFEFDQHLEEIKNGFAHYCGKSKHFDGHRSNSLRPDDERLLEYTTPGIKRSLARP